MRKLIFLLLFFLLAGCSLKPVPAATAIPTVTSTPKEPYYPPVDLAIKTAIVEQIPSLPPYEEFTTDDGTLVRRMVLIAISSGKTDTLQAGDWTLDVVWVYERNASVSFYPLVMGVQEGDTYTPYYMGYAGAAERQEYLDFLQKNDILERGRRIYPSITGDYVSRAGIDWQGCGESVFCRLGRYMQETYALDRQVQLGIVGVNSPIPEGWALAFLWNVATEDNTLPEYIKVNLP